MKVQKALDEIFVSSQNQDVRAKIKALIGSDIPSIVQAWGNHKGYDALQGKDVTALLLNDKILDDDFQKFLQSLNNLKANSNSLSKKDFIYLFKILLNDTGYMYQAIPYIEDILNYLGYAVYLIMLSGFDFKLFNFISLKAKYQDNTYKDPNNPNDPSKQIKEITIGAHARVKPFKVKRH